MTSLPTTLYTASQTRLLDQTAIAGGIPGFTLMKRAARAVFAHLQASWPEVRKISVLCGGGNNGGDGFVVAALAHQQGYQVQALYVGQEPFEHSLQGEAREAWGFACAAGVQFQPFDAAVSLQGEVVVDALLGTGLSGEVRFPFRQAVAAVNCASLPVISVDIPSGLCADTGQILGEAVRADMTVSFIGLKQGLFMHQAVDCVGELVFNNLRVPESVYDAVPVSLFRLSQEDVKECLPPRPRAAHKGMFGHLLVVGGDSGMGGAALMAAEAALVSGAGKVTLATRAEHVQPMLARAPEVMVKAVRNGADLAPLLASADAVVLGPGLGQSAWGEQLLQAVCQSGLPVVLDADAINLLAGRELNACWAVKKWVWTPHPGEAARLLKVVTGALQQNRLAALAQLQARVGGTVVLKGAGSLIGDGDAVYLCSEGNPGMATGGMGDLLSGIIGALLAQHLSPIDAARIGVYAHACAGDLSAMQYGERGLRATELLSSIRQVLNS